MAIWIFYACYWFLTCKSGENEEADLNDIAQREDLGLPSLDLATVAHATDDFSVNNKLGEGGFGPVYKVILQVKFIFPTNKIMNRNSNAAEIT